MVAGAAVAFLGSWPVSIMRAAMSKLVEPSEQGEAGLEDGYMNAKTKIYVDLCHGYPL